jgi:hypothetical protein
MIWLLPHPLPPLRYIRPATNRKTEKQRQLAEERGREGMGESYDSVKAWSSINHSILSGGEEQQTGRKN